jgi:hypothetical protein
VCAQSVRLLLPIPQVSIAEELACSQATIIEVFGAPGDTTPRKTQVPAVTPVGQHSEKGACA